MTHPKKPAPQNGPPQGLISWINHLGNLLKFLLDGLPLDLYDSKYYFGLDMDDVEQEGVWYAFNHNLKACFKMHKILAGGTIVFCERGSHLVNLIKIFKNAITELTVDADWTFLKEVWLERLIKAAELQGAKIVPPRWVNNTIIWSDRDAYKLQRDQMHKYCYRSVPKEVCQYQQEHQPWLQCFRHGGNNWLWQWQVQSGCSRSHFGKWKPCQNWDEWRSKTTSCETG